jgi:IS5 family transposase
MFDENIYRDLVNVFILKGREFSKEGKLVLQLRNPLNLDDYFADSTCVSANIHFPVDWVLLRDACRTFCKAIFLIRREGLKSRMDSPKSFMKKMNQLCIEMTHCRRKKESKKHRKKTLRKMKTLSHVIKTHAEKHRDLLDQYWESTSLSRKQAEQIINRMDRILESLPKAINQAHERIIGERPVAAKDKLLSLYEPQLNVIVRGKAGAEVEFGNTLMIAEQSDGFVIDWKFVEEASPGDSKLIEEILERSHQNIQSYPNSLGTDRGFVSKKLESFLAKNKIFNGVCPKNVSDLKSKLEDKTFVQLQSRRSQTEGRISILKNKFLGKPMRSKGFENRNIGIASAIFTHNLWVLARLPVAEERKEEFHQAA